MSSPTQSPQIQTSFPLSAMQRGMLLHHLLNPGSGVYIQQVIASIDEPIDIPAFEQAWKLVVDRHAILRTSFRWGGEEEALQEMHSQVDVPFESWDWHDLSASDQELKFAEFLQRDRERGFDLSKAPAMRLALFQTGETSFRFVWTNHHIISDGRSRHIALNDFIHFYDGLVLGKDVSLDPAPQYQSYIEWSQKREFSDSEPFWRERLADFNSPTVVDPVPKLIKAAGEKEGKGVSRIWVDKSVTSKLVELARQNNFTLNTIVQGAWAILLSRYSGEEDVLFGAVRACRNSSVPGAEGIVGLFINTLPVRVRVNLETNLFSWLSEIREHGRTVWEHEQTPLLKVIGWSEIPLPTRLFESYIVFDYCDLNGRLRMQSDRWTNWEFSFIEETEFPLVLYGFGGDQLSLEISYDKSRFDDETVRGMLRHLSNLLGGMAEGSDKPLRDLNLLTEGEKDQILVEWNKTAAEYELSLPLHGLFEAQVRKTPDSIAVSYEELEFTYAELNSRANKLAHALRKMGVGPDVLVGVYMERSLEMVVALYAILKAGGAYVPLDPEYPRERVAFMLEDTQVPVLLTQDHLRPLLPDVDAKVLAIDSAWEEFEQENAGNPNSGVSPTDLAYVIYTSGSTGRPKGVMNTHRGIVNRLLWMQEKYQLDEMDRILQKTPFSFDVSVWEFFWPLLNGARLVIARPGGHKDSAYLVRTIVEQEITTLHFVPSMLQIFLEDRDVGKCRTLQRVICSGEALPFDLQERFFERLGAQLHNLYGPTEAAVDVSYWECVPDGDLKIVPIGRPVANTQLYVLDGDMQPVPIGVLGELHIGGVQVARGYLNRPNLTGEKFIPDPFSPDPDARLYKTGDLVRFLPDGNIEFSGRLDHQVKVRGFRIELGEIEAVLGQHPQVREVVLLADKRAPGDTRLVAYLVPGGRSNPAIRDLRDYLLDKLPEYMIPSAFVVMDALPLSPNGKVDRRKLPPPEWRALSEGRYQEPERELEKSIAVIWRDILDLEDVGINDNFFDLGGHSLLLARAHNQVRELVGKDISITDMFRYPTIRTLSEYLSQETETDAQLVMQASASRAEARREAMERQRRRRMR